MAKVKIAEHKDDIIGLMPYMQYRGVPSVSKYFAVLKELLFNNINEKLALLEQVKWSYRGDNDYLQFYYTNLFLFKRSFGESKVRNLYDTSVKYDSKAKYDDRSFTGYLDLNQYKILIKYFFDYADENYTLGWIYALVMEFCSFKVGEVSITCEKTYITINCRRTTESVLLQRIFLNKQDYANVPIVDIRFNLTN